MKIKTKMALKYIININKELVKYFYDYIRKNYKFYVYSMKFTRFKKF